MIAVAPFDQVPLISWRAAVLAVTYRGMCMAVSKGSKTQGILLGCPLLLLLWSYERLQVGRPSVDRREYNRLPASHDDVDRPTMGLLWCLWKVRIVALYFLALFALQLFVRNTNFLVSYAALLGWGLDQEVLQRLREEDRCHDGRRRHLDVILRRGYHVART